MADQIELETATETEKPRTVAPHAASAQAPEKSTFTRWLLLGALVVLVVAGILTWRYLSTYEDTDDAQVDGHVNEISGRVAGYVQKVNVEDNQLVQQGAVLVQIDPRDYEIAVEHAKADLADAEASAQALNLSVPVTSVDTSSQVSSSAADLATAQAGVSAAQRELDAARAQLLEAQANSARAQADLVRYRTLVAKDEVSQQVFDQADAAAKASAAAVEQASASVAAAEQEVAVARGRVGQADAAVQSASTGPQQVGVSKARAQAALANVAQKRAALDQAELNLQYCNVTAAVTGVVKKDVEVGMNVQPGQTLLSVVPIDDLWVTANFKETQLQKMRPGQRVTIVVDAYGREYKGHVDSIAGASGARFSLLPPENATGNYVKVVQRVPVKIVLDPGENQDHLLRVGMSVEPKVWLQ
jgi:membrane fusion protein (multidrug efflux system)